MSYIYNLTDVWNNAGVTFTGIKMAVTNTASNDSSKLLELTVSGSTTASFAVDKIGNVTLSGSLINSSGSVTAPSIATASNTKTGFWFPSANAISATINGIETIRVSGSRNVGVNCVPLTSGKFAVDADPSTAWQIDLAAGAANRVTIGDNVTYSIASGSGALFIYETGGFCAGMLMFAFGSSSIIWQYNTNISTTVGTAGKINIYYDGGSTKYIIQNKSGSDKTVIISTIRLREFV